MKKIIVGLVVLAILSFLPFFERVSASAAVTTCSDSKGLKVCTERINFWKHVGLIKGNL